MTPEQIAQQTECYHELSNIRAINRFYLSSDYGRTNVTRAIILAWRLMERSDMCYGIEYCYMLEHFLDKLINETWFVDSDEYNEIMEG